jgi:AraC-like DNA-binding protein
VRALNQAYPWPAKPKQLGLGGSSSTRAEETECEGDRTDNQSFETHARPPGTCRAFSFPSRQTTSWGASAASPRANVRLYLLRVSVMCVPVATITAFVPWALAHAAVARGAEPAALWSRLGLAPDKPPALELHLPIRTLFALWEQSMLALRDASFPLQVGSSSRIEDLEVFGFLALTSKTLGEAYTRTAGVRKLWATGARWELDVDQEGTLLSWYGWPREPDLALGQRCSSEATAVDMVNAIRQIVGRFVPVLSVSMPHARCRAAAALERFFGGPVLWDTPQLAIMLPAGVADWPVAQFNSRLRDYFQLQCDTMMSRFVEDAPLTAQVRKLLALGMDGRVPTLAQIARSTSLSTRSLQRKLAEEGSSLQVMVDEVRAELAKRYLARPGVSASEVSYLVGFSDTSAFFKAFKRWTGVTPKNFQTAPSA